jgi:hypothetical protein
MENKYEIGTKLIWKTFPHTTAEITSAISGIDKDGEAVFYVVPGFGNHTAAELEERFYIEIQL